MALAPMAGGVAAWVTRRDGWRKISPRELIHRNRLPNLELITHEGKTVRFYDDLIKGKKVVINFMYSHCQGICLPVTNNLVKVQKMLGERVGKDIFFYSITLKADQDAPADLQRYAEIHGVGPGWLFLTGSAGHCETLRRKLGFTDPDPVLDADVTTHAGNILFGNEPLMLWATCPGQADPEWIVRSIISEVDRPLAQKEG
jgi:protein SCO1/2